MWLRSRYRLTLAPLLAVSVVATGVRVRGQTEAPVDFGLEIRPILSDRCFACHGPDANERQGGLRLDLAEGITARLPSGAVAVVPGRPEDSEMYRRIALQDGDRMPPPSSKLSLSQEEIARIRRWIAEGAEYGPHWSFQPLPERVAVPAVHDAGWPRNPIDRFVLHVLERVGLPPSGEAPRARLLRRASLTLTGLPPMPAELDAFEADDSPDAYGRAVDRLLASPRYGERMASDWLDLARYADTYGYQNDVARAVWPWRDWVVDALNRNMPFDRFVTWQLAGDLLPDATAEQVLATTFQRLHRQTNEGGSVEEEFRQEYVADRVQTFGTALLGMTIECARCHDHKFDPVRQEEFYELAAFFNSIDESGLYSHFTNATPTPALALPTADQRLEIAAAEARVADAEAAVAGLASSRRDAFAVWLSRVSGQLPVTGLAGHFSFEALQEGRLLDRVSGQWSGQTADGPLLVPGAVGKALLLDGENNATFPGVADFTRNTPFSLALWVRVPDHKERAVILHRSRSWTDAGSRGYQLLLEGGRLGFSLIHFWPGNAIRIRCRDRLPHEVWKHVVLTYDGSSRAAGMAIYVDGARAGVEVVRDCLTKNITGGGARALTIGQRFRDRGFEDGMVDELQVFHRCLTPIEAAHLFDGKALPEALAAAAHGGESAGLFEYYLHNHDGLFDQALGELREARVARSVAVDPVAEIMVMRELPEPRPTFLLSRGQYDAPAQQVRRDTPDCLPPFPEDQPRDRLGLSRWLFDPRHPLTARVAVNRIWQMHFGVGLVATAEDFGSQGQLPSHPRLLDWLARELIDSGWNVKALHRLIVTSATFRQSSSATPELRARDPENRLLARGPRFRLPAEVIRDQALWASGLLVEKLGGPPVKPYQPPGLWKEKSGVVYQRDEGEGLYRRSLYTFWKRTSPPPSMMILDAAKRDVCVVRRQSTTTPVQALVLWNDPQFVEASRVMAERLLREPDSDRQRLVAAFRAFTGRRPLPRELGVLETALAEQRRLFERDSAGARALLAVGDREADPALAPAEAASLAMVLSMLMSFEEAVTQR